jgi:hypothetical protein
VKKRLFPAALLSVFLLTIGAAGVSANSMPTVARVNYTTFLSHVYTFGSHESATTQAWQDATELYDDNAAAIATLHGRNYARTEYRWLVAHTPDRSCFRSAYTAYRASVHYSDLAFSNFYLWHRTGRAVYYNRGYSYLVTAIARTKTATARITSTRC